MASLPVLRLLLPVGRHVRRQGRGRGPLGRRGRGAVGGGGGGDPGVELGQLLSTQYYGLLIAIPGKELNHPSSWSSGCPIEN